MIESVEVLKQYPLKINSSHLQSALALYQEIVNKYRAQYGCELANSSKRFNRAKCQRIRPGKPLSSGASHKMSPSG